MLFNLKLEATVEKMKASPSQIFKEAESVKASLSVCEASGGGDGWQQRQELCHLLESLLLMDLDFALDKKVEQDLWSFCFRNPISAYQSKAKEHKKSNRSYNSSQLSTLLETASGFYLQLLQKLCCAYDIDLPCHPKDSVYGLSKEWVSSYPIAQQPRKSSLMYICQHCLVHLGDIARYRGQSLQAETFYRHAVDLVPSNGQPYNQLALLEAASGEKLSTVFFYVRSLCVQHPFPLAATNLHNLFSKMSSSDVSGPDSKTRITAFEYVTVFLQFHAVVHLNNDLMKTEPMIAKLTTSLPSLIIAEKFETWQLVQMVAVCLFAIEHAWGTVDIDRNSSNFDESMLSPEELKSATIVEELLVSMLHAFLLPVHASPDPKSSANYYTLPAVKVILDWLLQDTHLLQHEAVSKNPQVWHGLCKLLNDLDATTKENFDQSKLEDIPLPEDWELHAFLPLKRSQKCLKFSLNTATPSDEEAMWLRSIRLCKLGECLTNLGKEGMSLLSISDSDGKRMFKAIHQSDSLSEEVLQQIQELKVTPGPSNDSPVIVNGNANLAEAPQRPKSESQEVRFKLDNVQQRKEKSDMERESEKNERRTKDNMRRSGRQNVAMQAILQQQRAAQLSSNAQRPEHSNLKESNMSIHQDTISRQSSRQINHLDNSHHARPSSDNCMTQQKLKEVNMNRSAVQLLAPEQLHQLQQQIQHAAVGLQQCDRNEAWLQQLNFQHSTINSMNAMPRAENNFVPNAITQVVRPPAPNYSMQQLQQQQLQLQQHQQFQQQAQMQQQQVQQQVQMQQQQVQIQQQQNLQKQAGSAAAFIPSNPNWNYLVAPYPQASQIILQPPQGASSAPRQQGFFMVNGTAAPAQDIYHGTGGTQQPPGDVANQRMWQQDIGQVVNRSGTQVMPNSLSAQQLKNAPGQSGLPHDMSSNTYSLFNSPWQSCITIPRSNNENQQHGMDSVLMQSRAQSLWSGPGPSPLERLLEQQKQRRDNQ